MFFARLERFVLETNQNFKIQLSKLEKSKNSTKFPKCLFPLHLVTPFRGGWKAEGPMMMSTVAGRAGEAWRRADPACFAVRLPLPMVARDSRPRESRSPECRLPEMLALSDPKAVARDIRLRDTRPPNIRHRDSSSIKSKISTSRQ